MSMPGGGLVRRIRKQLLKRGQSETIGFILLFSAVLIGSIAVVALGATAVDDTEQGISDQRAETTLTQFDSTAGLVVLGESDRQRLSLPTDNMDNYRVNEGAGSMNITVENRSSGNVETIVNQSLGSITYEYGETEIAYQGGGVWRNSNSNGSMISPPEFHYRDATLTLPIVNVTGDNSLSNNIDISQNGEIQRFPNSTANGNWTNPLDDHVIEVTVQSDYYIGWGEYFKTRTDGEVSYNHSNNEATLLLAVPATHGPVQGGLVSGTSGTLRVNNNAEVDSYNSSLGPYSSSQDEDTKIISGGDIIIGSNAVVDGNVEADGNLIMDNNAELNNGNISYGDPSGPTGGGWMSGWTRGPENWVAQNASASLPDTVRRLIDDRREAINSDPDNSDTLTVSGNQISCSGSCMITEGEYYLDSFELNNGDDLTIDTSSGDVEFAVDGDVDLNNNANIDVTGSNRVSLWVEGDVTFFQNAEVNVPGDNSTRFWMYMNPNQQAVLNNNNLLTGVIFGPSTTGTGAEVILDNNAEVWGGIVGDIEFASNNLGVHYDEALANIEAVEYEASVVRITYLHITTNEIEISS